MPMGLPYFWTIAFWGGMWGVVLAMVDDRFGRGRSYWRGAALFGAIVPSAFAWLLAIVTTGAPLGGSTHLGAVAGALVSPLIINALWGLATALFLMLLWLAMSLEIGP